MDAGVIPLNLCFMYGAKNEKITDRHIPIHHLRESLLRDHKKTENRRAIVVVGVSLFKISYV